MKFSIENWQQVIPRDMWKKFALEEAHATSMAVQAWMDEPESEELRQNAIKVRNDYVQYFIEREEIDTSIVNMVPYGIDEDIKFRIALIKDLSYTAEQILAEIQTIPDET